jgi:hypothetical protein
MKRSQNVFFRPPAIHPRGIFDIFKSIIIRVPDYLEKKQICKSIGLAPSLQNCQTGQKFTKAKRVDEVSVKYEGENYSFSIHGEYCRPADKKSLHAIRG